MDPCGVQDETRGGTGQLKTPDCTMPFRCWQVFTCYFRAAGKFATLNQRILPRNEALEIAGLIATVAGMASAVWARVHLGSNWSSAPMIKEHHQLVRSGPYHWVRHPIYTGLRLSSRGTFLAKGKMRGALGVSLIYLAFVIKSRIEEEFMGRTFGSEYEDYRRSTRGIIPRLLGWRHWPDRTGSTPVALPRSSAPTRGSQPGRF